MRNEAIPPKIKPKRKKKYFTNPKPKTSAFGSVIVLQKSKKPRINFQTKTQKHPSNKVNKFTQRRRKKNLNLSFSSYVFLRCVFFFFCQFPAILPSLEWVKYQAISLDLLYSPNLTCNLNAIFYFLFFDFLNRCQV